MGLFSPIFERRSAANLLDDKWYSSARNSTSDAGELVSGETAIGVPAIYAAIRLISESIAKTPLVLYRRRPNGERGKDRAEDHALHEVIRYQPNPEITAFEFWQMLIANYLTRGDCYAEKETRRDGQTVALWPLWSHAMTVKKTADGIVYKYDDGSLKHDFPPEAILHIRGFGFGGLVGLNTLAANKHAIGIAIALQKFVGKFFANGAHMGGFLQTPTTLNDKQYERLEKSLEEGWSGLSQSHRVKILEAGLTWQARGIDPAAAQVLESRTYSVLDVSRVWSIPPHKLMELTHATFTNIEHQNLEFLQDCLDAHFVRIEQRCRKDLILPRDRRQYFAEFLRESLIRTDIKTQHEAFAIGRQWGWLSADDICDMLNRNPLPNKQGTVYLDPLNMVNAMQFLNPQYSGKTPSGAAQ